MYEVFMMVGGNWESQAFSHSFSDCADYARVLRRQNKAAEIKIVGPEGTDIIK